MNFRLTDLEQLDRALCDEFFGRLQSSISVKTLCVVDYTCFSRPGQDIQRRFYLALAQIKGLESLTLEMEFPILEGNNWFVLWKSISEHASLKQVHFKYSFIGGDATPRQKACRTRIIIRALESNHQLNTITGLDPGNNSLDKELLDKYVWPKVTWNLFRPRAQSFRQEPDQHFRSCLLGQALLHPSVHQSPTVCYLFLSQNADLIYKMLILPTKE